MLTKIAFPLSSYTIQWETFEGENFHQFRGFVAIRKHFLREIEGVASFGANTSEQSAKLFSANL